MEKSILKNKLILAVDENFDTLSVIEEEILDVCPNCELHKTTNYYEAAQRMLSRNYDMVILDVSAVGGLELARLAMRRKLRVAMLTAGLISLSAPRGFGQPKTQACLPIERLAEIVPFLEGVLRDQRSKTFLGQIG